MFSENECKCFIYKFSKGFDRTKKASYNVEPFEAIFLGRSATEVTDMLMINLLFIPCTATYFLE